MKKLTAMILAMVMVLSLAACGAKDAIEGAVGDAVNGIKEKAGDAVSDFTEGFGDAISDAAGSLISGAEQDVVDAATGEADKVADEIITDTVGHDLEYWADRFETSMCPFSISYLGLSNSYHFRAGGKLDIWAYTADNTAGWYVLDGYMISGDGICAIKIDDDLESLSSCCEYEASPYAGKTLTKEERDELGGIFYTVNPYTPIRTNWGFQFIVGDVPEDLPEFTAYGFADTLKDQEWFTFFIDNLDFDNPEAVKLWAFEHRDRSEYPEIIKDELLESAVSLGDFKFDEAENETSLKTFIPNEAAGGFAPGKVDLVMTYGDSEYVTVGVMTVSTLAAE